MKKYLLNFKYVKYCIFGVVLIFGGSILHAHNVDSLVSLLPNLENPHEKAKVHREIAELYFYQDKFKLAEDNMLLAGALYADDTASFFYNKHLLSLSAIYIKQEFFNKALACAMRSINLAEIYDRPELVGLSSLNCSVALKELFRNQEALKYAGNALKTFEIQSDSLRIAYACNTLGMISKNLEDYKAAEGYYRRSLHLRQKLGRTKDVIVVLANMAVLHKNQGSYDSAYELFLKVGNLAQEHESALYIAKNYHNLGELMLIQADTASAINYFDSCLVLAAENGFITLAGEVAESLAEMHFSLKNYEKAWDYNRQFKFYTDSLTELDRAMQFNEMELLMENRSKQSQIESLELSWVRNMKVFHIVVIFLLVIIIILIYLRSVRIKKAKDLLDKSEKKFRMLAENAVETIWSSDLELNLTYVSRSTVKLFGYTAEERIKKSMLDVFGAESYTCFKNEVDKKLQQAKTGHKVDIIQLELKGVHKNGQEVWVEVTADFAYDKNGNIKGLHGIARNITNRKNVEIEKNKLLEHLNRQEKELKIQNEKLLVAKQAIEKSAKQYIDLLKAEHALAESERKFKDLFNDIPDAVFITGIGDRSGEIIDVNAAAEKQTGYSREELLGMNVLSDISIMHDSEKLTHVRENKLKRDDKIKLTEQKRRKDGSLIWTEVVVQKIVIDGEILALSVSRDISERVKIQKDLQHSEARVSSLLNALPDLLFIFDKDETFVEYHTSNLDLLIVPPQEFLNKKIEDVLPAYLVDLTRENMKKTFETGDIQRYTYHIDTHSGERTYFDARMVKATENTVLTVVRDITYTKRAEEDRKQNEEKYKTIFRNTPLGVFNFNSEGVIIDCNDFFIKIIGSSRDALIGFNMLERLQNQELKKVIRWVIKSGSGTFEGDYTSVTGNKTVPVRAFFKSIYNDNGEFVDGIGIVEDVSEQRKHEEQLLTAKQLAEQSDKLKSSFMATMSHELRTPLNTVIGFSDMIEESMPIDQILEFTQVISRSGRHLLSIIEDILDISLIDSGEVKLVIERFLVDELLDGLINFAQHYRMDLGKEEIEISMVMPESLKGTKLSGDIRKVNKVFGHLIKNALKFTRTGKIEIGIDDSGKTSSQDQVLLYVKDTGIGIPKDKHDIIFEVFRQADDSSTREFEGTGLGLSISKKLIDMMGGRIWLESVPGKGSTFYFELPLKAGAAQTLGKFNKYLKPKVKTMKGTTVLVAEDDDTNFHLFKLLLTRRQIEVVRAKNGEESVSEVKSNPDIKLVLMDINMPVLNGYEATKAIKNFRNDLPVVAVTAYAMVGDKERAEEAGCDDYITKPINNQVFYETISKYL